MIFFPVAVPTKKAYLKGMPIPTLTTAPKKHIRSKYAVYQYTYTLIHKSDFLRL